MFLPIGQFKVHRSRKALLSFNRILNSFITWLITILRLTERLCSLWQYFYFLTEWYQQNVFYSIGILNHCFRLVLKSPSPSGSYQDRLLHFICKWCHRIWLHLPVNVVWVITNWLAQNCARCTWPVFDTRHNLQGDLVFIVSLCKRFLVSLCMALIYLFYCIIQIWQRTIFVPLNAWHVPVWGRGFS